VILVAGNYCHDTLIGNAGTRRTLGGSAAYAAAILEALGEPFEVVAKVGEDFLYQAPRGPRVVKGRTTSFVDDYRGGERHERVEAVCEPLRPEDLQGSYDVGLACAVAGELPPPTLARLRSISRVVIADAQALLREISSGGEVRLRPPLPEAVACVDVLKASRTEAAFLDLDELRKRVTLLVTDGPRGSKIMTKTAEVHVPAFPAIERDPTGAGDCYLAGFAAGIARRLPLEKAARIGAYCGARAVESVGVPRLTRDQAREALAL
jgi:1D-myo-inositol 3-kinase